MSDLTVARPTEALEMIGRCLRLSQIAKANMPRMSRTQSSPHSSYAWMIVSVSERVR